MMRPMRGLIPGAFCGFLTALSLSVAGAQTPPARTVWDGAFTASQADRGRTLYAAHCAQCHGGELQGGEATTLVGETFWVDWAARSVGDLVAYVSKNMPFSEDGSLAGTLQASTYADIVAHLLRSNGFPAGSQELTAASGAGVQIIRKDGSTELPASTLAHVVGCLGPRAADGSWPLTQASNPARVVAGTPPDRTVPLGARTYPLKFVLTNLTKFVGHRVSVTGLLLGPGGADGLNMSGIESLGASCN